MLIEIVDYLLEVIFIHLNYFHLPGRAHFRIGKSSGTAAIRHLLHENGMDVDIDTIRTVLPYIRKTVLQQKRCLDVDELKTIITRHNL